MKDEGGGAELAAQVEFACQDLVVGMALGEGHQKKCGVRSAERMKDEL
jgi:hypothetical protein